MTTITRDERNQNQELGTNFSVSYVSSRVGAETLEPQYATFPDVLAGSKIESGVVWTSKPAISIEDVGVSSGGQTHCSGTPTPVNHFSDSQ